MTRETDQLSVDQFLSKQSEQKLLATIEAVEDEGKVKITPWVHSGGCLCHYALHIPKDAIEGVEATGDSHTCCGKALSVASVRFKEGATIGLNELFEQIMSGASEGNHHGSGTGFTARQALSPALAFDSTCFNDCIELGTRFFNACFDPRRDGRAAQLHCADLAHRLVNNCIDGGGGFRGCHFLVRGLSSTESL